MDAALSNSYLISKHLLACRLREQRLLDHKTQQEVNKRLTKILAGYKFKKKADVSGVHSIVKAGVSALETAEPGDVALNIESLEIIANAYDMHRLLLDPLISRRENVNCIVQRKVDFVEVSAIPGATTEGVKSHYRYPRARLNGTENTAIVWLGLEGSTSTQGNADEVAHSDTHSHGGNELMWVLSGTVEVRLDDSGLRTKLDEGEFIHFYAEQAHSAWKVAEMTAGAEVLIIRFYPSSASSRHQLATAISKDPQTWSTYLKSRVRTEFQSVVGLEHTSPQASKRTAAPTDPVGDSYGLGRLLQLIASEKFRGKGESFTLSSLAKKAQRSSGEGTDLNRSRIDRLHHGQAGVMARELRGIAQLYEVEPFLLYDYLFPARRTAIVVRGGTLPSSEEGDWRQLPDEYLSSGNVRYYVPTRRLADSDTSIAIVELSARECTPRNRHPGHEVLIPLAGSIRIQFGDGDGFELRHDRDRFAQFDSSLAHRVVNDGVDDARFVVVRFYE